MPISLSGHRCDDDSCRTDKEMFCCLVTAAVTIHKTTRLHSRHRSHRVNVYESVCVCVSMCSTASCNFGEGRTMATRGSQPLETCGTEWRAVGEGERERERDLASVKASSACQLGICDAPGHTNYSTGRLTRQAKWREPVSAISPVHVTYAQWHSSSKNARGR